MKKILGISFVAMLAVSPMMAMADPDIYSAKVSAVTGDNTSVATAAYVKGAYNSAITAVGSEETRAKGVESGLNTRLTTAESTITKLEGNEEVIGSVDYKIAQASSNLTGNIDTKQDKSDSQVTADAMSAAGVASGALNTGYGVGANLIKVAKAIADENSRATTAEGNLSTAISSEETRAKGVESGLNTRLTTAEGAITTLNANASTEGSVDYKIAQAQNDLSTAISSEETRATGVEEGLNTRLTAAEGDIDDLETAVNGLGTAGATKLGVVSTINHSTVTAYADWNAGGQPGTPVAISVQAPGTNHNEYYATLAAQSGAAQSDPTPQVGE